MAFLDMTAFRTSFLPEVHFTHLVLKKCNFHVLDIQLEYGEESDSIDEETVCGVGNKKDERFKIVLEEKGVKIYESTIEIIKMLRDRNVKIACGSSSKNCQRILQIASKFVL